MYVSRMESGGEAGYTDLEQAFKMAREHVYEVLWGKLRRNNGLDTEHRTLRDNEDIVESAALRLNQLAKHTKIAAGKQAVRRGMALGNLVLHSHLNTLTWPSIVDSSLQQAKTEAALGHLYNEAYDYLEKRLVLHKFVRTYSSEATPRCAGAEQHGLAWAGAALVLMAEDEGRFQDWAAAEVVRGCEDLLGRQED